MTDKELKKILENHKHYLNRDCKNYESMRADLSYADLHDVDLSGANLFKVNLYEANLSKANLSKADLRGADLCRANLSNAKLYRANLYRANLYITDLSCADLCDADLGNANLSHADLSCADLRRANLNSACLRNAHLGNAHLSNANLRYADLSNANLSHADLSDANLSNADLSNAFLQGAIHIPYVPTICPEEDEFIGWKKAVIEDRCVIVKLKILSDAKRSSGTTRKCRCSKAQVLMIYNLDGTIAEENSCHSSYDERFLYEIGKTVTSRFDEDRWVACTAGIHFFMSRQEAVFYDFS